MADTVEATAEECRLLYRVALAEPNPRLMDLCLHAEGYYYYGYDQEAHRRSRLQVKRLLGRLLFGGWRRVRSEDGWYYQ